MWKINVLKKTKSQTLLICVRLPSAAGGGAESPFVAPGVQDGRQHLWELHDRGKTLLRNLTRQASIKGTRITEENTEKTTFI